MNNLRKNITIALVFFMGTMVFYAQEKNDWEKIKSLKVAYFTEKLALTSSEAKNFWPVYDAYEKEMYSLHKEQRSKRSKSKSNESLTDAEANTFLEYHFKFEEDKLHLSKAYYQKISKVLSSKKTYMLIRIEEDFKRQLIRQYRSKGKDSKK
ncbi:hypothetical protein MWU65_07120 [Cellulophaga sp. F20128]|uniref:hypothetical protein n=1 Tax=Cellulophaga sp. F20128 TaxID=2926413 RepID=UPI001FF3C17A|nr:hypothetical protein [Cellulophaga sp. F20128]MCK0156945.1 hypothetical protein [Cellulophaga sp. F20128]